MCQECVVQCYRLCAGWKSVEVGDGLLLGSAEGGFCGLEVLSPEDIGGNGQQPEGDETVSARKQGAAGSLHAKILLIAP